MTAHLWQSTLFAALAWLLAQALRKNRAAVRYWVWMAASLKFFLPFSLLVALGGHFAWRTAPPVVEAPAIAVVIEQAISPVVNARGPTVYHADFMPVVGIVWALGMLAVLAHWFVRWRKVRALVDSASPAELDFPVPARSSNALLEPGVFGILRPVLLLPADIAGRLAPEQLRAILTHEAAHVHRRDNLTAFLHMLVEAAFWFHPLVWWIGTRLVDERERACDEEVLRNGAAPEVYAESILAICRLYVEAPACVAGVTGASLKKRIHAIMSYNPAEQLTLAWRVGLAAAAAIALAAPIALGILNAPPIRAQSATATAKFEVASVKRGGSAPANPIELNLVGSIARSSNGGRFHAANASLQLLIQWAFDVKTFQIAGTPAWANSEGYDITAKAEGGANFEEMRPMLQCLLTDRFKLKLRRETRTLSIYELAPAKGGPKIKAATDCIKIDPNGPPPQFGARLCGGARTSVGGIEGFGVGMAKFAELLSDRLDRTVIDNTGFAGTFDFQLNFTPDEAPGPTPSPSLFEALQDQMGLRLVSTKGPVDVLVIDHVERPSEN